MTKGTIAIGAVLALGLFGVWAVQEHRPPQVDQALAQALLPVVDDGLQKAEKPSALKGRDDLRPQWFCSEDVVEIRPAGAELKVGLYAGCEELGTDGSALREGTGWWGPRVVTVTEAPHRVVRIDVPIDGAGHADWIKRNFSREGNAEIRHRIDNGSNMGERIASEARLAFDLPPDAPKSR